MTILEYIKKEHANIKQQPKEERWRYFWDYYKWHLMAVVLAIVLLVQGVVGIINRKEVVLSGILLNCMINIDDEGLLQGFYDFADVDSDTQEAAFYTDVMLQDGSTKNDINSFQRIVAGVATKELDFVVGQTESFRVCAHSAGGIFMDLRSFLDNTTLEKLSDRLYYIDGAVLKELNVEPGTAVDTSLQNVPNPKKPETMVDPIPVGIDISDRQKFQSAYYFPNTTLYIGIIANTPRTDLSRQFVDYLMQ